MKSDDAPAHSAQALDRAEGVVDGVSVAVWTHSQTSVFGATPMCRVVQASFGTMIGPRGLYGEARRTIDQRLKSLVGSGRWHVLDRAPKRWRGPEPRA